MQKQSKANPTAVTRDSSSTPTILGQDNFLKNHLSLVKNKRVGFVTNPSAVDKDLNTTADLLYAHPQVNLVALFGPEHGIRGAAPGGDKVKNTNDPVTGLPVYSLYGKTLKPTEEMLENIDVLIFEIQDIGVRGYTYIYTMAKVMEAAAEFNKKVIILDRPNPIGGLLVEGNLVQDGFFSFIGLYPIPYRHGMTIGELAGLFNQEYDINCDLTVIPMKNYTRDMLWAQTGLHWVPTSPHVPHWETVLHLAATGTFGELHTLSEGVGYTSPFENVGAPWIDARKLAESLNKQNLAGVFFRPLFFKPYYARFEGEICGGVQLHITNINTFQPYRTGLFIMQTIMNLYPGHNLFENSRRVGMFNKAVGTDYIMNDLMAGLPVEKIEEKWQEELSAFLKLRENYLLY